MDGSQGSAKEHKALTQEQVDGFWTNGFLPIGKVLTDDEISLLRQEYDREFARARAGETFIPQSVY